MKMEEQEVLFEDYTFLWRLASLQHALVSSSTDPVVLRSVEDGADFEMNILGGIYYDCVEDQEKAFATMGKRIRLAESDLRRHFQLHKSCLDHFLEMDGAIIADDREVLTDFCSEMCNSVLEYVELVKQHKERLGESSFLLYPHCPSGHYFHILNGNKMRICSFNEGESYFGATSGVRGIQEQIVDFKIRQEKLPYIHLPLNEQEGAGLVDPNFVNNLRTNKNLLEKVGLNLSLPSKNKTR